MLNANGLPHESGRERVADKSQSGSAVLVVVWLIGLIALFATSLALVTRFNAGATSDIVDSAKARHFADGGASLAIRHLVALQREPAVSANPFSGRSSYQCALADGAWLDIAATSEFSKIDVNSADRAYLRALFLGLGATQATTNAILDRLDDFIDPDDLPRTDGAEAETYAAAGLSWKPRNGFLETIDELGAVWGLPPDLVQRAQSHLTVHTALGQPDMERMANRLRGILRRGGLVVPSSTAAPDTLLLRPDRDVVGVRATATLSSGARFVRNVIVELDTSGRTGYRLRRWQQGTGDEAAAVVKSADQTPCL